MLTGDRVWYHDVSVLWRRPTEFFPGADHTPQERINALVRLIVYASLATFAYNRQAKSLVVGAGAIAVVSLAFNGDKQRFPTASTLPPLQASGQCTPPTKDNPFGNMLLTDKARSPACPYDSVKDDIRKHFNTGLFRNSADVHEVENSQRQWYTMPVTNGLPDTDAFANFLYGTMKSCKSDQAACVTKLP